LRSRSRRPAAPSQILRIPTPSRRTSARCCRRHGRVLRLGANTLVRYTGHAGHVPADEAGRSSRRLAVLDPEFRPGRPHHLRGATPPAGGAGTVGIYASRGTSSRIPYTRGALIPVAPAPHSITSDGVSLSTSSERRSGARTSLRPLRRPRTWRPPGYADAPPGRRRLRLLDRRRLQDHESARSSEPEHARRVVVQEEALRFVVELEWSPPARGTPPAGSSGSCCRTAPCAVRAAEVRDERRRVARRLVRRRVDVDVRVLRRERDHLVGPREPMWPPTM